VCAKSYSVTVISNGRCEEVACLSKFSTLECMKEWVTDKLSCNNSQPRHDCRLFDSKLINQVSFLVGVPTNSSVAFEARWPCCVACIVATTKIKVKVIL